MKLEDDVRKAWPLMHHEEMTAQTLYWWRGDRIRWPPGNRRKEGKEA
jgi:hypothetical protein